MPPPQTSSISILGFIAVVASGALLSCSLHKIEEGLFACIYSISTQVHFCGCSTDQPILYTCVMYIKPNLCVSLCLFFVPYAWPQF